MQRVQRLRAACYLDWQAVPHLWNTWHMASKGCRTLVVQGSLCHLEVISSTSKNPRKREHLWTVEYSPIIHLSPISKQLAPNGFLEDASIYLRWWPSVTVNPLPYQTVEAKSNRKLSSGIKSSLSPSPRAIFSLPSERWALNLKTVSWLWLHLPETLSVNTCVLTRWLFQAMQYAAVCRLFLCQAWIWALGVL